MLKVYKYFQLFNIDSSFLLLRVIEFNVMMPYLEAPKAIEI
ncbi:MAG: hypothetical protein ABI528_02690 [bacterium]